MADVLGGDTAHVVPGVYLGLSAPALLAACEPSRGSALCRCDSRGCL